MLVLDVTGPQQRAGCPPPSGAPPISPVQGLIFVDVDGQHVVVNAKSGKVQCADSSLKERVERALGRMQAALSPLDVSDLGGS